MSGIRSVTFGRRRLEEVGGWRRKLRRSRSRSRRDAKRHIGKPTECHEKGGGSRGVRENTNRLDGESVRDEGEEEEAIVTQSDVVGYHSSSSVRQEVVG